MIAGAINEEVEENSAEPEAEAMWRAKISVERCAQTNLLRDLFRIPFASPPAIDHELLAWNDGTILKLAQSIYLDRQFDSLPRLADNLEGAGCDNAEISAHCRQPGEHVRGCWVVDLILGKT